MQNIQNCCDTIQTQTKIFITKHKQDFKKKTKKRLVKNDR